MRRLLPTVRRTIEQHGLVTPGDRILVAVSGGVDSVVLLDVLQALAPRWGLSLYVGHVNHGLRPEAEAEARWVAELARSRGVPCAVRRLDGRREGPKGQSPQARYRLLRYQALEAMADEVGASRLATGHHADDQAETILLRLLRGAGLRGLAGIPMVREGRIIRPLLEVWRAEIEAHARARGLASLTDPTNARPLYLRNRIRHELLPLLEKGYNPRLRAHLRALARQAGEDEAFLTEQALQALVSVIRTREPGTVTLDCAALLRLHPALRPRVLRLALEEMGARSWGRAHLTALQELAAGRGAGRLVLPGGLAVVRDAGALRLSTGPVSVAAPFAVVLQVPGTTPIPEAGVALRCTLVPASEVRGVKEEGALYRDQGVLPGPLLARSVRPGDRFRPLGLGGSKKLQDFLVDRKVPRAMRARVPLLVSAGRVVGVAGLAVDEGFKVTETTAIALRVGILPL
ncbi:MAG: tRNA lysidine(34) synthetase TilS [Deltaproteobacteria bacterium]|nr:tRNA lysidine(34) synthetase TilS [Deltaproteobacteria bacterium]